jgi:flavin reductase (DIM6/NTAB) family NADH-FMN oxidoreductase RutF
MRIDIVSLPPVEAYRFLIAAVVPRPIAWIATIGADGTVNLAPFSFFMGVTSTPPTLSVAIADRQPIKDTLRNLRAQGEAVVHIVPAELTAAMHASSGDYAPEVSEVTQLDLPTVASTHVRPPRLSQVQVACECRMSREILVGNPATSLCLLEIVCAHVDPAVLDGDGRIDPHRLRAVARLGGRSYLATDAWQIEDRDRPRITPPLGLPRTGP